ncbi:Alpha-L-rhamnosidase (Glycosyl hydrolase 78 family protein P20) (P20_GH78) (Polysaccharide utilization locus H protein P20) (PUL H protein P20) [Durusdinium trenchii]|uniref:alpha-L-rhamnosidase n=1 Tax=Durusdinium trenchii TaxID=1381693 RepID=A0ABP0LFS8_9DINO
MINKWPFWLVVVVALVGILAYRKSIPSETVESPSPKKIAFVTGGSGDYWQYAVAGAEAAAKERGIELDVRLLETPESLQEQMQVLSALGTTNADAIAVSPLDESSQVSVINSLATLKPVVTFDSDAPQSTRHGHVGTSNFSAGLMAGTLVKTAIPEGGEVVVLMANTTKSNMQERKEGFQTRIAESPNPDESAVDPRFKVIAFLTDDGDSDKCKQLLNGAINDHPDLACVVAMNSRQGPIVASVLKEQDKVGKIKAITFDTPEETLVAVEEGVVFATIAQDPYKYGYEAISMLDQLCRGDENSLPVVGRGAIHVSVEPIKQGDVEEFRKLEIAPLRLLTLALLLGLVPPTAVGGPLRVVHPTCEFAVDPSGVDSRSPRLSWQVESGERGARQTAWQIIVASRPEMLAKGLGDLWDSGKQKGSETLLHRYEGKPLHSSQKVYWKSRSWNADDEPSDWSPEATFTMGVLDGSDWQAEWIVAPWQTESVMMRRSFPVKAGLKRAIAHVCGLGQFEMSLNGKKSGDHLLAPGWTKYNRTCLYETHDITPLLNEGQNAVGIVLGDGMYHTERRNRFSKFQGTFGPQRAIVQIELEYEDGTIDFVVTDDTWRVAPGPITYNDIFGGEDYDARRESHGWDQPGFDDASWAQAVALVRPKGNLRGQTYSAPSIEAIEICEATEVSRDSDARYVLDLGQNASFMPRIVVTGPKGSTVRFTHAEVLDDKGHIDRGTCGGNRGPAYWQYTKATDGQEEWFPKFFYAGCRFLQVDLLPAENGGTLPELDEVEGVVVHSTAAPAGDFATSNELINDIRTLVRWAQRSNMVSVLTDCPHREKLGWLEQYHLNGPGVRYEFDANRIFIKGMQDMADSQLDSGLVPNIAPEYVEFPGTFRAAAEWGCAVILVPWQHYQATGDRKLLADYYKTMQRYLEYLSSIADNGIVSEGLGDWYDLGPADRPGHAQLTPPPVTATAFYFRSAEVMAQIAEVLGKDDDAKEYNELAASIRDAWQREFRNEDGTYATGSQCSNSLALVMGLAAEEDREAALRALVEDVESNGNAMTAGDVGFRYLLQALAEGGRSDVIYTMINQSDRPGYGYQLAHGATSLTEAWDANHHASHNHFMLGHITEWFYKDLIGISPDPSAPGYKKILIRPNPVG